jgi:hypothetical protein
MKKIAIIGSYTYHLECISFLLEIFKHDSVNIYISSTSDNYGFLEYYKTLFNFKVLYNEFSLKIIHDHDLIFKLTSDDKCLDHEKIISILHLNQPHQLKCKSIRFLSLTPYITGDNISYTFPVFYPKLNDTYDNMVTMITYFMEPDIDEDLINFINMNNNYTFNFIIRGSNNYSKLSILKNVIIYTGLRTPHMMSIINKSKYLLSKKRIFYDRFSGQLNLSVSFEKPIILDLKNRNSYNIPAVVFDKNYCEIGKLDLLDNYECLKTQLKNLKGEILQKNTQIINSDFNI